MTNFWDALDAFKTTYTPPSPIEYRLYYSKNGNPLFYTTDTSLEGNYVIIDRKTYQAGDYNNVKVIDGILKIRKTSEFWKLVPMDANSGTPCHPDDISIITDKKPSTSWGVKDYEFY